MARVAAQAPAGMGWGGGGGGVSLNNKPVRVAVAPVYRVSNLLCIPARVVFSICPQEIGERDRGVVKSVHTTFPKISSE